MFIKACRPWTTTEEEEFVSQSKPGCVCSRLMAELAKIEVPDFEKQTADFTPTKKLDQ